MKEAGYWAIAIKEAEITFNIFINIIFFICFVVLLICIIKYILHIDKRKRVEKFGAELFKKTIKEILNSDFNHCLITEIKNEYKEVNDEINFSKHYLITYEKSIKESRYLIANIKVDEITKLGLLTIREKIKRLEEYDNRT